MEGRSLELSQSPQGSTAAFFTAVYGWMTLGLVVTAACAYGAAASPAVNAALVAQPLLLLALFGVQLVLVGVLSACANRLSPAMAGGMFLLYAAVTGVTLSLLVLAYTGASLGSTFVVAAGTFGALSVYGAATQRQLSGVGRFCMMALIGLILALVIGLFWQNDLLQFGIAVVGVIVFAGLTAYDTQRLEAMAQMGISGDGDGAYPVVGALTLYLDLLNLFLSLLRLFGRRRQ